VFKQPTIETPAAFRESQVPAADEVTIGSDGSRWKPARPAEQQARGEWWRAFNDPALTGLIE
jgi:multidrug efflux system outer membrane protein